MADRELQHVAGLAQLAEALRELPQRISRNVLRGSVAAGATVVKKQAVASAPVYTGDVADGHPPPGTLKKSIYAKQQNRLSTAEKQVFFVTIYGGKRVKLKQKRVNGVVTMAKKVIPGAYYWQWVEYGTSKMQAQPFMRPAFRLASQAATEAMRDYMVARIPAEVAKLPK